MEHFSNAQFPWSIPVKDDCSTLRLKSNSFSKLFFLTIFLFSCVFSSIAQTAISVPTWRYDNTHSGLNAQETSLTPTNVNANNFGKLFSVAVDGYVYAQPLYAAGMTMSDGNAHDVMFIATEHDSVYAFDADTNGGPNAQPLWKASLLDAAHGAAAGATTVPNTDVASQDLVPEVGISSTPVFDPVSKTLYVVSKSKESGGYVQRLHALNMVTGNEQPGSPVVITATAQGKGQGSSGGTITFTPLWQLSRVGLDLFNGYLYISYGSHGDNGPYHGWLLAYNAKTLAQTGSICLSPNGAGNGIWSSGAAPPIDTDAPNGRLFLSTGNGTLTTYPPLSNQVDYGESILRFDLGSGTVNPGSAFTTFNQAEQTASDTDLGAGGELMLPDQPGPYPHELIHAGKDGRILLLNRDNLGGYAPGGASNTNIVQDLYGQVKGLWSTPTYWNGHVYFWANSDFLKRFDMVNGLISTTPTSTSTVKSAFPGATPSVSSNGNNNAIVWAIRTDNYSSNGSAILYAFDATNLGTILYESDINATRDDAGPANKFAVPVVANGKVYVAAAYQVDVYGLLNGALQADPPTITPASGTYASSQQVTMTTDTPNGSIYYTTDGSLPTPAANLYTGPFTQATDATLRAVTSASGYLQSTVTSVNYNFSNQTPAPTFSPAAGTYTTVQTVAISDTATDAKIYYTTDGTTPTTSSAVYTGPITVSASETLQALATSAAPNASNVATAVYTIQLGSSGVNFGNGFANTTGLTLNGNATAQDDSRLQLTTGNPNQHGSAFYNTPLNIQSFTNDFEFQLSDNPQGDGFTFTIQNVGPTALGPTGGGLGYAPLTAGTAGGINNSIAIKFDLYNNAGEGPDSTGLYENAAPPTVPAIDLRPSGIDLHSGDSMAVHMVYDGTTLGMTITDLVTGKQFRQNFTVNIAQVIGSKTAYVGFTGGSGGNTASQKILTWTFVSAPVTTMPTIAPNGGTFALPQSVTLNDAVSGAKIYYTIDGTVPTTTSNVYSGPVTIESGIVTLNAMAAATNQAASPINSATFMVNVLPTDTPILSEGSGTYVGTQRITITDTTPGAVIYYTTDGSIPSTNSTVYTSYISVANSQSIKAIALAPGYTPSIQAAAGYTIQAAGETVNDGGGFTSASTLALKGHAQVLSNINALQLTDGKTGEAAAAWYSNPVYVGAFATDFTFQMLNPVGDGFTFTLQAQGATAQGSYGSALGYASMGTGPSIRNSVAIKFDLFDNAGEGPNSTGIYTDGAMPTIPATDLRGTGIDLHSGDIFHAYLVYNGTTLQLTITDTVTSATYTTSYAINIPQVLGNTLGYVGFTGGTGGGGVTTNILNWTYTSAATTTMAEPTFSPAPGTYANAVSVSLSALGYHPNIYYTVDGSQPTHASPLYTGAPIQVTGTTLTIKALSSGGSLKDSPVVVGTYVVQPAAQQPVFSPTPGIYSVSQTVSLSSATPGATIYYTTDGSAPTTASAKYTSPMAVSQSKTIRAIAVAPGVTQSIPGGGAYFIQSTGANFKSGFLNASGITYNGVATNPGDGSLQLTDMTLGQKSSAFFNVPVDIRKFQTSFTFQLTTAVADGFTFAIQSNASTAIGPIGGGLGYGPGTPGGTGGIPNSVAVKFDLYSDAGEPANSTGVYINGASPTTPAVALSGIVLKSGDPILANLAYDGTNLTLTLTDQTTNAVFTQSFPVNIPAAVNATSAYVGFTAGTGGSAAIQKILNWTYTPIQ